MPTVLASELPPWIIRAFALLFGAAWGSFFNVAIHRWPRGESVVTPPSHCPACGAHIRAGDNIPILGWLLLRGRARCCGARISARYPLVELMGALLCTALAERFIVRAPGDALLSGVSLEALAYFAFAGGLLVATFVDLDHMEIPDEVSLPGAALGLATAPLRGWPGAEACALGAGGGYLVVQLLFVWTYERLTGRRGMGEGDAKLLMMIGAFVGWRGALFALVAGAMQGLVATAISMIAGRPPQTATATKTEPATATATETATATATATATDTETETATATADNPSEPPPAHAGHLKVPFGPFLALGALEFLFFGDWLIDSYLAFAT